MGPYRKQYAESNGHRRKIISFRLEVMGDLKFKKQETFNACISETK